MIKTLTKHGNSFALVIDRGILELLNITPTTRLNISTDGDALIISPVRTIKQKQLFLSTLEKVNRRYHRTLKKLAG